MRRSPRSWIILAAVVALGLGGQAYAFHDGGVAECGGCHAMHSSPADDNLLVATDASSTCLACHENANDPGPTRYHISTPAAELVNDTDIPKQRTPGGDFGWLRQDLSALASYYAPINNYGYERGHNIIAADNDYTFVDGATAPGGTMPSGQLGCASCHDPHGQGRIVDNAGTYEVRYPVFGTTYDPIFDSGSYIGDFPAAGEAVGVYRLLGGNGYAAFDAVNFPGAPVARIDGSSIPGSYRWNRSETRADPIRVAYGYNQANGFTSWGLWCATCHPGMHETSPGSPGGLVHPTDGFLAGQAANYNAYVMTGDLTGNNTNSFTSLVPYASSTGDLSALDGEVGAPGGPSSLAGPAGGDRMACFSCHRAHAGGWKYILRWNGEAEFLTLGDTTSGAVYPGVDNWPTNAGQFNRGYTEAQMAATYYDRPAGDEFSPHQRVLCNKCHIKD